LRAQRQGFEENCTTNTSNLSDADSELSVLAGSLFSSMEGDIIGGVEMGNLPILYTWRRGCPVFCLRQYKPLVERDFMAYLALVSCTTRAKRLKSSDVDDEAFQPATLHEAHSQIKLWHYLYQ
jgi:hypothetical protein